MSYRRRQVALGGWSHEEAEGMGETQGADVRGQLGDPSNASISMD